MEKVSALLAICDGNLPATGGFPSKRVIYAHIWFYIDVGPLTEFQLPGPAQCRDIIENTNIFLCYLRQFSTLKLWYLWLTAKQSTSHYLNQCWPSLPTHICGSRRDGLDMDAIFNTDLGTKVTCGQKKVFPVSRICLPFELRFSYSTNVTTPSRHSWLVWWLPPEILCCYVY